MPGSSDNPVIISSQQLFQNYSLTNENVVQYEQQSHNSDNPFLTILEQPKTQMRFRYPTEKGSHGYLTGQNSKSFPTVMLENYKGSRPVFIRAKLFTNEEKPIAHVHSLCGLNCINNVCICGPLDITMTARFENLKIAFCPKKNAEQTLLQRYQQSMEAPEVIEKKVLEDLKKIKDSNYSSVKILFEAYEELISDSIAILASAFSQPIYHQTDIAFSTLKICRLSKLRSPKKGNEVIFLLCDKVDKNNIAVRFFECDENGDVVWQKDAEFCKSDVHHQYAIVFRTPPYDGVITANEPKKVQVQLYRPRDQQVSESHEFEYVNDDDDEQLVRKRRKGSESQQPYSCSFHTEPIGGAVTDFTPMAYSSQHYLQLTPESSTTSSNIQTLEGNFGELTDFKLHASTSDFGTHTSSSSSSTPTHYGLKPESKNPILSSGSRPFFVGNRVRKRKCDKEKQCTSSFIECYEQTLPIINADQLNTDCESSFLHYFDFFVDYYSLNSVIITFVVIIVFGFVLIQMLMKYIKLFLHSYQL